MSNCLRCGAALPLDSSGELQGFCPACHAQISQQQQAAVAARPRPSFPVTITLIVLNGLIFVVLVLNGYALLKPTTGQVLHWGGNFGPMTLSGQWWRLFSSMFLHIGIVHLLLNMWCLWNLGWLAESLLGRWTYLTLYLAAGVGGDLFSLAWNPMRVGAGASGAIFGVAGALITGLYFARLAVPRSELSGIIKSVALFAFYNLVFGLRVGVDNMAHLGGLVTGMALGLALAPVLSRPREERGTAKLVIMVAASLAVFGGVLWVSHRQAFAVSYYKGEELLRQNNAPAAITELERAAAQRPNEPFVQATLGLAYEMNHDEARAIAAYHRALAINPNMQEVRRQLERLERQKSPGQTDKRPTSTSSMIFSDSRCQPV